MISAVSSNFDAYGTKLRALYPSSRSRAPDVPETDNASSDPPDHVTLGEEEDFRRRYAASIYVRPRQSPGSTLSASAAGTRRPRVDLRTRWNKQRYS